MQMSGNKLESNLNQYAFEQGPIRPPSESYSLLIRVTRNCPWNRCQFCGVYKGSKFELRTAEEVIADVDKVKHIAEAIKLAAGPGNDTDAVRDLAAQIYYEGNYDMSIRNVALWLWSGAKSIFLQDANSLIAKTPELVKILKYLKESFPEIDRITSYARSKTAAQKSQQEMNDIHAAGLSRLHIGMESGSDKVLAMIDKGVTGADHIAGGKKVKESGISLSEYIMPGIGGRTLSEEHALDSAAVLNKINPDFIRLRSTVLSKNYLIWAKVESGEFVRQTDDEIAAEIRKFIEHLEVTSYLASDHIMNLLPDVEGKFPEAKSTCLAIIDNYLSLPDSERTNYKLGRRMGIYERLEDTRNVFKRSQVDSMIESLNRDGRKDPEDVLNRLKARLAI